MPESRDRLSRAFDVATLFARRRSEILAIYEGQPDLERALFVSPCRPQMAANRTGAVGTSPIGRGRGTPRGQPGRGRNIYRTSGLGRENTPVGSMMREMAVEEVVPRTVSYLLGTREPLFVISLLLSG